jgi:hypothetical protein
VRDVVFTLREADKQGQGRTCLDPRRSQWALRPREIAFLLCATVGALFTCRAAQRGWARRGATASHRRALLDVCSHRPMVVWNHCLRRGQPAFLTAPMLCGGMAF